MDNYIALYAFIKAKRGAYKFELSPALCLEMDLKITGDDAYEFMHSYASTFNVDIKKLEISQCFANEGSWSMYSLLILNRSTNKREITIEDLCKGIMTGILKS